MKDQINKAIQEAVNKLYPEQKDIVFSVELPPENIDADYASNAAMVLAKKLQQKPMDVAKALIEKLTNHPDFELAALPPGFINFKVADENLIKVLEQIFSSKGKYGARDVGKNKLVIDEYFQLNVAKPPHVGHLRSGVIGDALKRIFKFLGYKTVSDTHIGDWGTQFGILLLAYKRLNGEERVKNDPLNELNQLYVEINEQIESKPELREAAKQEFVKLEQGDKDSRELWEYFVKVSKEKFAEMVTLLRLQQFEHDLGESFYLEKMPAILDKLKAKGLLTAGESGEQYVDLEKYKLGRLICVKSDGATTYELRDLATVAYRYDELAKGQELAWNLYVVDNRQAHDFRQVFKTMEMLGYDMTKSKHVDFGFMKLPEGAISTRKGRTISLEALVAEAEKRALAIIQEKNPDLKDKERVANQVALAAIKYFDLSHNRKSDIVFDWEKALSFEGNTGPYLQYTHARLKSILRKAQQEIKPEFLSPSVAFQEPEYKLLRKLSQFPEVIENSASNFMPSLVANYLYELAASVNSFYHALPVLAETDEKVKAFRMSLVSASAQVLQTGLNLLGIEAPEEM